MNTSRTYWQTAARQQERRDEIGSSATRCFRSRLYRLLPLLVAVLLMGFYARPVQALDVDALIGFGQSTKVGSRYRPDSWTPLTVFLSGPSVRGTGQLQVTVRHGGTATTYTRRVLLRDGTMNEAEGFVLNLRNTEMYGRQMVSEVDIQLLVDGRKIASKKLAMPVPVDSIAYSVLALTRDNSGLNFLTKKKLGLVHRHTNPNSIPNARFNGGNEEDSTRNGINPNAVFQLLYTDARALPSLPQGYEAVDAIALADQPLDSLTDSQTEAIKTYVRQGGLLIVSGGGDLSRLRSQFFTDLLPITPRGVTSTRSLPDLEKRYGSALEMTTAAALTEGALKPGAMALFGGEGRTTPLISVRPYGAGRVVFTSFDYVDPTFRGWNAAPALWRDLLRTGNDAISPRELLDTTTGMGNSGQRMVDALAGKQASNTPEVFNIGLFLTAYILLLLPINYLILKRLDRREMAWITIPVLIIGFTGLSYVMALGLKGGALSANRAVIVETTANSDQAAAYGQMTIYSPRRASYDIAVASDKQTESSAFVLRDALGSGSAPGQELTLDSTPGATGIRGALIRLWDKRSFDTPLAVSIGGGIEAHTRMLPNKQVEVIVTNKTPYALQHCALIADDQTVEVGDLSSGQTSKPLAIPWATRANAVNIPIHSLPTRQKTLPANREGFGQSSLDAPTRDKIITSMATALTKGVNDNNYNYGENGRGFGKSINAFVGWFYDPLMTARIDGKPAPTGDEVNMLFAHLPVPDKAALPMRALSNPFVTRPVLNLEDELPPGARKAGRG